MQILEELWYGRINPIGQETYQTGEYLELWELFGRNEAKLLPTLNEEQQRCLQNMKDQWEEWSALWNALPLSMGFGWQSS